ncbi:MAG TPA: GspH/FimT family pseudopilin [Methylophilus sp.]|uniref:GspH/FimT family pseudopilin n=1 Tax=Methylophilus sp. TaxID=29541 RepID=UPI002C5E77B6|nr:GspH/FimT family pseudopilin [Methylophilus sp.]HSH88263.1 GspH/FimT family pseudopilin [Methylophilus sp.]
MQQQGFSLIELVVTVVVLMTVSVFAIPAFQTSIGNSQIRTVTESIKNGLQQARVEAIKRNARIRFTLQENGAWELGCVAAPVGAAAAAAVPACPAIISQKSAYEGSSANVTIVADNPSVVFSGFGTRDPGVANGLSRVDVSSIQVAQDERRALRIILAAGGHARVCDPAVNVTGDNRRC